MVFGSCGSGCVGALRLQKDTYFLVVVCVFIFGVREVKSVLEDYSFCSAESIAQSLS